MDYVIATAKDKSWAIPIHQVKQIEPVGFITKVPGAPAKVVGITNIRGQVRAVLSGPALFGEPLSVSEKGYMIISEIEGSDYGVLFERVAEILDADETMVKDSKLITNDGEVEIRDLKLQ